MVKTADFGAFVNFFGARDGLVHISQLASQRVGKTTDVVKEGDKVWVKLLGFDERGKVRLSMKVVNQETGEKSSSPKRTRPNRLAFPALNQGRRRARKGSAAAPFLAGIKLVAPSWPIMRAIRFPLPFPHCPRPFWPRGFLAWAPFAAIAQDIGPSGLPLPRFVSTRSAPINVRVGPGTRYDIAWVFKQPGLPVEITQEYDTWRKDPLCRR